MQLAKRRAHQRVIEALISSSVQCQTDGTVIRTPNASLKFLHDKLILTSVDNSRSIAAFRYKSMNIQQIVDILQKNQESPKKTGRLTSNRSSTTAKVNWIMASILTIVAAGYALTLSIPTTNVGESPELSASPLAGLYDTSVGSKSLEPIGTNWRSVPAVVDISHVLQQMNTYEKLEDKDRQIHHTLEAGSWLQSNVESISKLSNHHIVWSASRDYRLIAESQVSGKGSQIAKTLYNAVKSEFNGNLVIVHCKNTTLITDAPQLKGVCGSSN